MIMAGPDLPPGRVVDTPVQLLDIFPTILEATGVAPTEEDLILPGSSLFALADGATPDRAILSQQHSAGAKSASFMIRRGRHKYVHHMDYPPQLFDLESDPKELNDLAGDPTHGAVLASCEAALRALLDPEDVDRRAKADQAQRIASGGGQDAIVAQGSPGYTPAPGEAPVYV